MTRERGVTVELLDHQKLTAAVRVHGLYELSFSGNALLRRVDGQAVVLSYEGVGSLETQEGMVPVDTMSSVWQFLPLEAVEACRTGETRDLADFIRTFGSRLDVNHWRWFSWAKGGER